MALVRTASPHARPHARIDEEPSFSRAEADFCWSHPEKSVRIAAWGEEQRRKGGSLRALLGDLAEGGFPDVPGPWFGATAFAGRLGAGWSGFPPMRFVLPQRIAWSDGTRHFSAGAEAIPPQAERPSPPARIVRRNSERERWNTLVRKALEAIAAGSLDKVVLARAIDVEANAPLQPEALLAALETAYPSCRSFLVRGADGAAFVGATPELLCMIDGDRVETEALAGSAAPADAQSLLGNQKELREHRWVVEHIAGSLAQVAAGVHFPPEPRLRALANVVHLHTPISARLLPGRGLADVAAALHPTPAVGGMPRDAALEFIARHEGLDRGLYAGLVGWAGPDRAELAVALRSALVRGARARLFVGAGIVEGSSADEEFEETELKARAMLDALGVAR